MTTQTTGHTSRGMNTRLVTAAAKVIAAAMLNGRQTASGYAFALDSAGMLQSPETAAELAKEGRLLGETIDDRDHFHDMADKLAYAVAPEEVIGEHSSMNCPWENALDLITPAAEVDKLRTELAKALEQAAAAQVRVAELEAERHTTNQALSDAAEQLRADRDRIAALEAAPVTIYRAEHPDSGITLGHYGTEAAARAHCEASARQVESSEATFDWIEDDEDRVAELVAATVLGEESTGYIVTALELDSEYDEEADQ